MNNSTNRKPRTIGELIEELPQYKLLMIKQQYGEDSPEYRAAEFECMKETARAEAEYQIIKAENRAMLYEWGY